MLLKNWNWPMLASAAIVLGSILSLLVGCETGKVLKADIGRAAVIWADAILGQGKEPEPIDNTKCERCLGEGRYPIRDTGQWQDPCDVCGGNGKALEIPIPSEPFELAELRWVSLSEAYANGLPTWVHFTGPNCSPCKALKLDAFTRPGVIDAAEGINCVELEWTAARAAEWAVMQTPMDVWVTSKQTIVGRSVPPVSDDFETYLRKWRTRL